MTDSIQIYGTESCGDCRRSKLFLTQKQIPYEWIDIETDPQAKALVLEKNAGKAMVPTIVFADGSFLAEPSNQQLAAKLGLSSGLR